MPKLIVCGDSFMTPVTTHPKTHFSEIVADELGYELVAYSRGGMSNGGIAIQIDTAIKNQADFILLGTTLPDRSEFPIGNVNGYQQQFSVEDIEYKHPSSISSHYEWLNKNPKLVSTNLAEIVGEGGNCGRWTFNFDSCDEPKKIQQALDDWFRYLYHPGWKAQTDRWIMYAVLHKLHLSNIPYLFCLDQLKVIDTCPWLTDSVNNVTQKFLHVLETQPQWTPGQPHNPDYHTSMAAQQQIAQYLISHITDCNINVI